MTDGKKSNVVVIDLTSNEDFDDNTRSAIDAHVNDNDIMVTSEVNITKANEYRMLAETELSPQQQPKQKELQSTLNSLQSSATVLNEPNGSLLEAHLTQAVQRIPSKEQITYNQLMHYFRRCIGFRVFAERNYKRAQAYAQHTEGKAVIHNILINWWTNISATEKNQYSKFAHILRAKKMRSLQNQAGNATIGHTNVSTSQHTSKDNRNNC